MNKHQVKVEQILSQTQWGYQAKCSCGWTGLLRDARDDYAYTECDAEARKHISQGLFEERK